MKRVVFQDNKKRVVFKRQKYHCVYEYPREVADIEAHSPAAYLPDLSTYSGMFHLHICCIYWGRKVSIVWDIP